MTSQGKPRAIDAFDRTFLTDVPEVVELLLVRHAQQTSVYGGPVSESFDPALSELGREQAKLLAERLSITHVDAVFTSPLRRARETAELVSQQHRLEPQVMEDLREIEIWREVPAEQSAVDFLGTDFVKASMARLEQEKSWDVFTHSESSFEFRKRVVNAIEAIIARNAGERVVVFCHGGVINAYVSHLFRSPFDMVFRPAHTSISVVAAGSDRRAVHALNDRNHLQGVRVEGRLTSY